MERQLIHNSVTCLECGETLVSRHRHDYTTCSCPQETMCDGGDSYERWGGKDLNKIKNNCLYSDSPYEQIREVIERGGRGIDGTEPLKYAVLKDINDAWLQAIIDYEELHRPENRYLPYYIAEKEWRQKQ